MNEFITFFKQFWEIIVIISGGVGGYFTWRTTRSKSTQMLYEEFERVKQQLILKVVNEVEQATQIAEKNRIIEEFKNFCPACYKDFEEYQEKLKNNGKEI